LPRQRCDRDVVRRAARRGDIGDRAGEAAGEDRREVGGVDAKGGLATVSTVTANAGDEGLVPAASLAAARNAYAPSASVVPP
jgi:hypothetical protein